MKLRKDGISVNVLHPIDIARLKRLGYVEVKPKVEQPPIEPKDFAESQQEIVEEVVQPEKKTRKKKAIQ